MKLTWRSLVVVAAVSVGLLALGSGSRVFAATNVSPNQDDLIRQYDYVPRANQQYSTAADDNNLNTSNVVSYDNFTDVYTTNSKIFVPQGYTGTLIVHDANMCKAKATGLAGNNYDQTYPGIGAIPADGVQAVQFSVGATVRTGVWKTGGAACWGNTVSFPLSGGALDPNTGMLVYNFTATQTHTPGQAGFLNMFWLEVPDPAPGVKAIISQSASTSAPNYGVQLSSPIPSLPPASGGNVYYDMTVPFAPDCSFITAHSATGKGPASVVIYDDDNKGGGVQPTPLFIAIQEFDRADTVNPSKKIFLTPQVADPTNFADPAPLSSAGAELRDAGSNATTKWYRPYTPLSKQRVSATFEVDVTKVYKLLMRNVYFDNTLQFQIPFDTVYFYSGCVTASDWRLTGATSSSSPGFVQPGDTINWLHTVQNIGPDSTTLPSQVTTHRSFNGVEIAPTVTNIPSGIANGVQALSQARSYAVQTSDIGKTVCEWITWTNATPTATTGATTSVCMQVQKSPYLAVVGGDVWAGGATSSLPCSVSAGVGKITGAPIGTLGSFSEYGAFATSDITNFISAGKIGPSDSLTFANTIAVGPYGNFTSNHCITNYVTQYADAAAASALTWNGGAVPNTSGLYVAPSGAGELTVSASSLGKDDHVVIYAPDKKITIAGDITYSLPGVKSFAETPSLIIIAKDIAVAGSVGQLNGLFYATDTFLTCNEASLDPNSQRATITTTGVCKNQLTIRGAVITGGKLVTPRTYGSAVGLSVPSELFIFSPEVFLTEYEMGVASDALIIDNIRELPPRY